MSFAPLGNMRPEVAVPMKRAEVGNHVGATKERILFYTAPRVQPHEQLPEGLVLPDGVPAWAWVDLDMELAELAGLSDILGDPQLAEQSDLTRASVPASSAADRGDIGEFLPDAEGYVISLPDGVQTQLRYKIQNGMAKAEIRSGSRRWALLPEHSLQVACSRVLTCFQTPSMKLSFSPLAAERFHSAQVLYNVKCAKASDAGDDAEAASWGAAPWHLGILSGLLVAFDIFLGAAEGAPQPPSCTKRSATEISMSPEYIDRARSLLDLLQGPAMSQRGLTCECVQTVWST